MKKTENKTEDKDPAWQHVPEAAFHMVRAEFLDMLFMNEAAPTCPAGRFLTAFRYRKSRRTLDN